MRRATTELAGDSGVQLSASAETEAFMVIKQQLQVTIFLHVYGGAEQAENRRISNI